MAQVSRYPLPTTVWQRIWEHLVKTIYRSENVKTQEVLLKGLLTETEQVMLAKRLMVALLLMNGWEVGALAKTLNLSTATVYKLRDQLRGNRAYQQMLKKLYPQRISFEPRKNSSALWDVIFGEILVSKSERYRRAKKKLSG